MTKTATLVEARDYGSGLARDTFTLTPPFITERGLSVDVATVLTGPVETAIYASNLDGKVTNFHHLARWSHPVASTVIINALGYSTQEFGS